MKISEVIVVEGKNDIAAVTKAVDAFCVSTSGSGITKSKIDFLKEIAKKRGIIVLMDPDSPGEKIRAIITEQIPSAKHAFIKKKDALKNGDVGIENAGIKAIRESLESLISPNTKIGNITIEDLIENNLVSVTNSSILRDSLSNYLNLGKCNGKTLLKRLNMLNISKDEFKLMMEELNAE